MDIRKTPRTTPDSALYLEAKALGLTIAAIRRARGKKNPQDFCVDSPEWQQSCAEFANDVRTALDTGLNRGVTKDV